MAYDNNRNTLTKFVSFLFVFSYLHHSKMHAMPHDKLLRALMVFELEIP